MSDGCSFRSYIFKKGSVMQDVEHGKTKVVYVRVNEREHDGLERVVADASAASGRLISISEFVRVLIRNEIKRNRSR
jgi:hypothetical protein